QFGQGFVLFRGLVVVGDKGIAMRAESALARRWSIFVPLFHFLMLGVLIMGLLRFLVIVRGDGLMIGRRLGFGNHLLNALLLLRCPEGQISESNNSEYAQCHTQPLPHPHPSPFLSIPPFLL